VSGYKSHDELVSALAKKPRAGLAQLPTPIHRLKNFGKQLNAPELWIKRDDLTGLEGGGNKTRKLEFLVGDALESGADMLVTAGAIQSNHTRQTAAAAAKCNMKCALLHFAWTEDAGPVYKTVGNVLLSSIMGAEMFLDDAKRPIEDQSPLADFCEYVRDCGHRPYLVPAGASEHPLGSFGYMDCAAEIVRQSEALDVHFDYVIHCTGSSSTQAGLVAGFKAMAHETQVIGVSDDAETSIKRNRVAELANGALTALGVSAKVLTTDIEVIAADKSAYGIAEAETFDAIRLLAETEGLIADPVYEGKALRGLQALIEEGRFDSDSRILLMHLGGTPAVHAYANQFGKPDLKKFPI